jgi:hypothetical protein
MNRGKSSWYSQKACPGAREGRKRQRTDARDRAILPDHALSATRTDNPRYIQQSMPESI